MAKRVRETLECDRCGKPAQRYELRFPDDQVRILDRCETHARKFEAMRDEPGEWKQEVSMRRYHKKDLDQLLKVIKSTNGPAGQKT